MTKKAGFFSVSYYLVALLILIIVLPFVESCRYGLLVEGIIMTLMFLLAVWSTGAGRKALSVIAALASVAVAGKWIHYFRPGLIHPAIYQGLAIIIGSTAYRLLLFILRSPRVDSEVLCAGVSTNLTLGLLWAMAYTLTDQLVPDSFFFLGKPIAAHAFHGFTALYFSFVTLCALGYGGMIPVSGVAQMLAILEAITGVFYVVIMISRLVALHSAEFLTRDSDHCDQSDSKDPQQIP